MSGINLPYLVEPSTAQGMPIIGPDTVLGNLSSANAFPAQVSVPALTPLLNPVSTSAQGVMPSISGVSTAYYGGDGTFHPVPAQVVIPTWQAVSTVVLSTQASVTFQNLNYSEVVIMCAGMTNLATVSRLVFYDFSADNGSTFLNTVNFITTLGSFVSATTSVGTGDSTNAAYESMISVSAFNTATYTPFFLSGGTLGGAPYVSGFVGSATALNSIRVRSGNVNFTGGTITVIGR